MLLNDRTEEEGTDPVLSGAGVSLKGEAGQSRADQLGSISDRSIDRLSGTCAPYFCSGPRTSPLPCRASAAERHPPAEVPITSRCPPRLPAVHRPLLSIRPPPSRTRFARSPCPASPPAASDRFSSNSEEGGGRLRGDKISQK